MTPRDSPLLIWVGNSEQPARREREDSRSYRSREQSSTPKLSIRPIPQITDSWFHTLTFAFCFLSFFLMKFHPANHRYLFHPPGSAIGPGPGNSLVFVNACSSPLQRDFNVLCSQIGLYFAEIKTAQVLLFKRGEKKWHFCTVYGLLCAKFSIKGTSNKNTGALSCVSSLMLYLFAGLLSNKAQIGQGWV